MELKESILVVDDNADNRTILEELLGEKYTILSVASGEEALRAAMSFRPQLVLLDVMMPGLNGIQTCRLLHEQEKDKNLKIVMLSARSELEDRLKAYNVGAVDYVTKPFDDREVLAKVAAWMQMAHRQQIDAIWKDAEEMCEAIGSTLVTLSIFQHIDTGDRLFRVRWYAYALAEQLAVEGQYQNEIDETFLGRLYRAVPLYDIGRVTIEESILHKASPLTESDISKIQQHTTFGAEMLTRAASQLIAADYLPMAAQIARHHHERFDGFGFPDRLLGRNIPLAARIVAVADMFDALVSQRRMSIEEAVSFITTAARTAFDPVIVDAFLSRQDDFCQASMQFAERGNGSSDSNLIGIRSSAPTVDFQDIGIEYSATYEASLT